MARLSPGRKSKKDSDTGFDDNQWQVLLDSIYHGKCVPFLGAGACAGVLPLGGEVAKKWSGEYHSPFGQTSDLIQISQYLAVTYGPSLVKGKMLEELKGKKLPAPEDGEPHHTLARLNLPLYLTTNYDEFMAQALHEQHKDVQRDFCRWNDYLEGLNKGSSPSAPSPAQPWVYHLHGYDLLRESLVLTEDDYLEFLANVLTKMERIPTPLQQALQAHSLLFVGYRVSDTTLRVLMQILRMRRSHPDPSWVVLRPPAQAENREKVQEYHRKYFAGLNLNIYWGDARGFCRDLESRWKKYLEAQIKAKYES